MTKNSKADRKKDEEKDLEEEEHDEGEGEEEEDEDEEEAVAKPTASAKASAARPRARAKVQHDDHDDHGSEDEVSEDEDDPNWWTPHAVLAALVLVGVLGFFGAFNKLLAGIAVRPAAGDAATAQPETKTAHNEPAHAEPPKGANAAMQRPPPPSPKPAPPVPEDVKAAPPGAKKTASGLAYRTLKPGSGKSPAATDNVTVNYTGWTTDGKMFDSSITRGQPASFRLNQVIKGWTEGVPLMKVGETARFWIPADLAYGDKPMRPGAPSGMLVFDIELISIQ